MSKPALLSNLVIGCALGFGIASALSCSPSPADPPDPTDPAPPRATAPPPEDVEARAREILAGRAPLPRLYAFDALLQTLAPGDVEALLAAVDEAALGGGDPEIVHLAMWWADFDPQAAHRWSLGDWRAQYGAVIAAVFRVWGHRDPERAFATARSLQSNAQQRIATEAAVFGWDESGAPGLVERLMALDDVEQQRLGEIVARRKVVALGAEEALRWAQSFENEAFRRRISLRVASAAALVRDGAPFAARWAEPKIAAAERPTGYPRRIGTRWVKHAPVAAMAWLASLPAGRDRDDGVTESFRDWLAHDARGAVAWIAEVETERWNEPAKALYARVLAQEDPLAALALAATLSDDKLRRQSRIRVGRIWAEHDRPAAEAWYRSSDLPDELVKKALAPMAKPRKRRLEALAREAEASELE